MLYVQEHTSLAKILLKPAQNSCGSVDRTAETHYSTRETDAKKRETCTSAILQQQSAASLSIQVTLALARGRVVTKFISQFHVERSLLFRFLPPVMQADARFMSG